MREFPSNLEFTPNDSLSLILAMQKFQADLPAILSVMNLEMDTLPFNDLCLIVEEFWKTKMLSHRTS